MSCVVCRVSCVVCVRMQVHVHLRMRGCAALKQRNRTCGMKGTAVLGRGGRDAYQGVLTGRYSGHAHLGSDEHRHVLIEQLVDAPLAQRHGLRHLQLVHGSKLVARPTAPVACAPIRQVARTRRGRAA